MRDRGFFRPGCGGEYFDLRGRGKKKGGGGIGENCLMNSVVICAVCSSVNIGSWNRYEISCVCVSGVQNIDRNTWIEEVIPVTGPVWPRGWVEVWLYFSMTVALEGGEWSAARPGRTLPPQERPGTHFIGGWVGPRAGLGRAENLVPTGIRSRTVQPVAQLPYRLSYPVHN